MHVATEANHTLVGMLVFLDADAYIGENGKRKLCIVLHFDLLPNDIRIYFRFMQYAPKDKLVGFNKYKEYVLLSENRDHIAEALFSYLKAVRADSEKVNYLILKILRFQLHKMILAIKTETCFKLYSN